jgi:transcriptional regulator with PAS, ATPase and Fis domain
MQRLFGILEQVAESSSTVLLVGESGTGKELFAKAIHSLSPRRERPMITINCGALPDTLLESELFGYKAGAFTDAKRDKPGRLALAEGGTLFLDEIGDISPALQIRLLRVLQEKTYEPLGSTRPERSNVRIVAATNKDLDALVAEGGFRQDLFYRINVVKLTLPPLRDRREDIPLLADHFVEKFNRLSGKETQELSQEVLQVLMPYGFPGNIRELENIIEHATVVCKNRIIGVEHLPDHLSTDQRGEKQFVVKAQAGEDLRLEDLEKHFLMETLKQNNWSRSATAAQLGIHPATLWRKIKRLKLQVPRPAGGLKV